MTQEIIKIKDLAALVFNNLDWARFCRYIDSNQLNDARLMVDEEIYLISIHNDAHNNNDVNTINACSLIDLIIDLIVNEIDDEGDKQIKPIIRKRRRRRGHRPDTLV